MAQQRGWERYAAAGRHHADDDGPAAGRQRSEGRLGERGVADDLDGDVDSALAGLGGDRLRDSAGSRVYDVCRAQAERGLAAVRLRVSGDDRRRAGDAGGLDGAEPDAAAADDQDGVAGPGACGVEDGGDACGQAAAQQGPAVKLTLPGRAVSAAASTSM